MRRDNSVTHRHATIRAYEERLTSAAGHPARAGRTARRRARPRPPRPRPGPRPRRRRRRQPAQPMVHHHHRQPTEWPSRTAARNQPGPRRTGPPAATGRPLGLHPDRDPGPPGGYGTWTLTLPGGQELAVKLEPIPVTDCDHRHESHGYQPSDTLRHLVQVRDGTCTFPPCSRHARESDFEHAVPYDKGGRTCACNGGARSRRCHRVKQSPGWTVTQPKPGWHQWTTPSRAHLHPRTHAIPRMTRPAARARREPACRGGQRSLAVRPKQRTRR